ncbi:MAG: SAM-dependent methyltransferase [Spirochaetes bacterium]|nr:SAM-dependent methyltransferase [Spirochaetota bacterium]MBU0955690.1 SAM-dependent methyltransferase [Spirochaetota bacterium]
MQETKFQVTSIGEVVADGEMFAIQLNPKLRSVMKGLQGFSHLQVYWWAHENDKQQLRKVYTVSKPYKKGPAELGIFATRSPIRPNPLAMTLVPVTFLDEDAGRIGLAFIDAFPGTPVLDIKPYYGWERVKEYSLPVWCSHWPAWYEDSANFDWEAEFENAK